MSAVLDKEAIRILYGEIEQGDMTWAKANKVYELGNANVEMYPWAKEDSTTDWVTLYGFLHPDASGRTGDPTPEELADIRIRAMHILRRLANRVIESGRPVTDMDAMAPVSEMTSGASSTDPFLSGFYNALAGPLGGIPLSRQMGGGKRKSQKAKFCRCIKQVRKTIRPRKGSTAEQAAIGVCVKSVLHPRGRTVKRFKCGRPSRLVTQKKKSS